MNYYSECIGILCDCEYTEDNILINSICSHCFKREEIEKSKPWYIEVKTINKLLLKSNSITIIEDRLPIIKDLFEYILTCDEFIAKNPRFRNTVLNKIEEFKLDERIGPVKDVLEKTKEFIANLVNYEGYKN